ncbi:MAG: hypothetical protein A2166_05550 [Omnitrophica WOR_2 bacterium RBG_13_41_10]|nr:MAG: hypothetical protein A2166_05550 [Omnitrophica WOR_2 bacterium RBG_13_41_10]
MRKLKIFLIILSFIFYPLPFISGCATITEGTKGFLGISTKELEKQRKNAIIKTFAYDYFTCFTKTSDILKSINAYIYKKDIKDKLIAIYVSSEDTTPVGIFFKEISASSTQIEVSSLSSPAKELIANKLFSALEEPVKTEQKEQQQ